MIPEVGNFALILAAILALAQAVFGLAGAARRSASWCEVTVPIARGQGLFVIIAFAALTWAFATNDFSVRYVAQNSNSALPLAYRVSAVWGAHEGSMLLWAAMLSTWTAAVTVFSRDLPAAFLARVLGIMGLVSTGFFAFLLVTSNPFARLWPMPDDGRDLNPLLQDPGLIFHPPLLYAGYVGFSVAFAFAMAALLSGRLDAAWLRWTRPWTLAAWMFLTGGICLGSFWAYYELGWGGWWFWDPVENASFMPWLVGTALVHSLAASEQRGVFKGWTLMLALAAFSLSLLGTFLVRSGVLTSVHAFATDPTRGLFILVLLGLVVGGALTLYAARLPRLSGAPAGFDLMSRETALFLNNVLLCVAAASILLGTLYPLATEAFDLGKISVGAPYFNTVFLPVAAATALLVGAGPLVRWKSDAPRRVVLALRWVATAALSAALVAFIAPVAVSKPSSLSLAATFGLGAWVLLGALRAVRSQLPAGGSPWLRLHALRGGQWGMLLAHAGFAVSLMGVGASSLLSAESHRTMRVGDRVALAGYEFVVSALDPMQGPNYQGVRGTVLVSERGAEVARLHPEKRMYAVRNMPMTEAGIDASVLRDFYVSLGEPLGDGAWSVRVYVKPMVRWIWFGALLMTAGGLAALLDRRYRRARTAPKRAPASAGAAAA